MRISFFLWAQLRVTAGRSRVELELPEGARLEEALDRFYREHPELAAHRRIARPAVGNEYAEGDRILREGDEVSLIPPVQGG